MDRRHFLLTSLAGALAAPVAARAQQAGKVYRIGFLGNQNAVLLGASLQAFRQGLRELGWVEGQNVAIDYRWADGDLEQLPALASDLIKSPIDVIVVAGGTGVRAALPASRTIPIVGAIISDPVADGFAASFARPAGP